MQARDVMTPEPLTASVHTPLIEVIDSMVGGDIRHMPILNGHELVGMISDRDLRSFSQDLLRDVGAARLRLHAPVSKVMSGDVISVEPEDEIDELIDLMLEHKVGAVPVVNGDGRLVGIVSYVDILRAASGKL